MRAHEFILEGPTDMSRRTFVKGMGSAIASVASSTPLGKIISALPKNDQSLMAILLKKFSPRDVLAAAAWSGADVGPYVGEGEIEELAFTKAEKENILRALGFGNLSLHDADRKITEWIYHALAGSNFKGSPFAAYTKLTGNIAQAEKIIKILGNHGINFNEFFNENVIDNLRQFAAPELWAEHEKILKSYYDTKSANSNIDKKLDSKLDNKPDDKWSYSGTATGKFVEPMTAAAIQQESSLNETLKRVKGKWALVSKSNPKKVL
jgi:hypothetical protein